MKRWLVISARITIVIYLALVAYVCFGHNFSFLPDLSKPLFGLIPKDKVIHFIMFLPFPVLMYYAVGKRYGRKILPAILMFLIAGCIVAGLTELGQGLTIYRKMSVWDFVADSAALVLSSLIVIAIDTIACHKK